VETITASACSCQGDLRGAEAAFQKATEADPQNPDGWVNIGRRPRAGRRTPMVRAGFWKKRYPSVRHARPVLTSSMTRI